MRAASHMNESERTELVRTLVEQSGPIAPPTSQDPVTGNRNRNPGGGRITSYRLVTDSRRAGA